MAFLFPLSLVFLDLIFFFAFLLNAFFFTVLSLSPLNVIFLILLSPINALELIVLTAFPITTVSSFEQFLNAFFPITVTLLPIVSFSRALQPANALLPIVVTFNLYPLQSALSGIVTFFILFFLAATTPITFDCPNVAVSITICSVRNCNLCYFILLSSYYTNNL